MNQKYSPEGGEQAEVERIPRWQHSGKNERKDYRKFTETFEGRRALNRVATQFKIPVAELEKTYNQKVRDHYTQYITDCKTDGRDPVGFNLWFEANYLVSPPQEPQGPLDAVSAAAFQLMLKHAESEQTGLYSPMD